MSRYLIEGVKGDLAKGLSVGVVAHTRVGARAVFADVAEAMGDTTEKIIKANGAERITSKGGGEFRVFSLNSQSLRGVLLDVLVVADRGALSYEQFKRLLDDVTPMRATRPNFELIAN